MRDLSCRRIRVDEIWSFVYAKEKNVARTKAAPTKAGDVWTWTAICADTKLVPSWRVGDRSGETAIDFMDDLRTRLAERVQLTSDGHKAYLEAVEGAFGGDVDYGMLVKLYGELDAGDDVARRYLPGECTGTIKRKIEGNPDAAAVSTSYTERNNLTMRLSIYRFTRLTNAFSKKIENHMHSVALHFLHYNFCRQHKSLKGSSPAMAAGATKRLWAIEDIVRLVDEAAPPPKPRGPCKNGIQTDPLPALTRIHGRSHARRPHREGMNDHRGIAGASEAAGRCILPDDGEAARHRRGVRRV